MQATFLLETFKYELALDLLLKAKFIYEVITKVKDQIEQAIYREKCSQLDTYIRQCTASLGQIQTSVPSYNGKDVAEIQSKVKEVQTLNASSECEEIKFNGKSIPLKAEKIKAIFNKVAAQTQEIKDTQDTKLKIGKFLIHSNLLVRLVLNFVEHS